jgi:hypothetical protein
VSGKPGKTHWFIDTVLIGSTLAAVGAAARIGKVLWDELNRTGNGNGR